MDSCVSYTNKNQVYDRQSLSAPACGIWFWKNQLYCFSRIASAVSVSSSSGGISMLRSKLNTVLHSAAGRFSKLCLPHIQKWKAPHSVSPSSEKCLFLPELFLLSTLFFPPVFVAFASWHDVYYHKPKEKSTKFPAYSAQRGRQKIVYDTNQKASLTLPCVGHL